MRLKQKIAIGLSLFYVLSVMGVALSMHFCSGKLADLSVFTKEISCKYCKDTPVEKKSDNCCKDAKVTAKVDDNHQVSNSLSLPQLFTVDVVLPYPTVKQSLWLAENTISNFLNKAPPLLPKSDIVVLHQSFRI